MMVKTSVLLVLLIIIFGCHKPLAPQPVQTTVEYYRVIGITKQHDSITSNQVVKHLK